MFIACIKTIIYFAVMYLAVILFNTISISRYKLITATKKNEQIKIKNPVICVIIFLIAASMLGYAYYKVTAGANTLTTEEELLPIILIGIVATFLVFWSLSGFILRLVQSRKKLYLLIIFNIKRQITIIYLQDYCFYDIIPAIKRILHL